MHHKKSLKIQQLATTISIAIMNAQNAQTPLSLVLYTSVIG